MIVAAVVWLPLLLGCVDRVITTSLGPTERRHRTLLWAAVGAVALALQVLAGHAEFTYYTLLVMGLYALWRLVGQIRDTRYEIRMGSAKQQESDRGSSLNSYLVSRISYLVSRPLLWLAAMVALGLLIAALQLVPLFEVGQVNFRAGSAGFDEVRGWAFPWRNALTLLLPDFHGNPTDHAYRDVFSGELVPLTLNAHGQPNPRRRGVVHGRAAVVAGNGGGGGGVGKRFPVPGARFQGRNLCPWNLEPGPWPLSRAVLCGPVRPFCGLHLRHTTLCPALLRAAIHRPVAHAVPLGVSAGLGRGRVGGHRQ